MNRKRNGKLILLLGLMVVWLSFMIPSDSIAAGGDSWVRHIYNNTDLTVSVYCGNSRGDCWLNNTKNGPYTLAPHSSVNIKYTTTKGETGGYIALQFAPYASYGCKAYYYGVAQQQSVKIMRTEGCWLGIISGMNSPEDGDLTIAM